MKVAIAGHPPLESGACRVIAEAGVNHHGSVEHAIEMSRAAAAAGAWAIKFQLYKADELTVRDAPVYWDDPAGTTTQHQAFATSDKLDYDEYQAVADACRELGIIFFATPFDDAAVDALERMNAPIYKIASGDITHQPLIERVSETGKPVILSTGASSRKEIGDAIEWSKLGPERLVLLACTLTYPTPDSDAHFARLETMRREFGPYLCGFSDHTLGIDGAWMTAALGGVCIEKHYTLDKTAIDVPDHRMSVDDGELTAMVDGAARAALLRGEADIAVNASELPAHTGARRSIVVRRPIARGEAVTVDDIAFLRPGAGMPPSAVADVLGRHARTELDHGHLLTPEDLD